MLLTSLACTGHRPAPLRIVSRHPGCFGLMNLETGQVAFNDSSLCQQRLSPASTFKIPHALIALEEGVLKPDEVFPWDGTPRGVQAWNQDQTLDTAMRRSALWVFQGLATRLGREREEAWMKRLHYGNAEASGNITLFWLGGPLRISPEEQLQFLARLYRGQLPVSAATQETVKRTLVQGPQTVAHVRDGIDMGGPWKEGAVLSAKTGALTLPEENLTWFVGHVTTKGGAFVFVSTVRSPPGPLASPHRALAAAIDALKAQGLL
ncbi:penicillin-binding transpeptidase domain-containing protein [Corallococcus sp. AS-1-12]|uniref:penicillin-binding transpeptidase domain-containing protein n=1 Tax=Corallococcus sp. AS-1-12 TaxID=2874598 RepID=UPI001CBE11EC|nr:serine hydrolase [Corallococcus sp. AS-1-12]